MEECRICLEDDFIENMISPCYCRGTNKYVHRKCLNQWRSLSENKDNLDKCPSCKFNYVLENDYNNNITIKPNLFYYISQVLSKNILILLFLNSLFVFVIGMILYYINSGKYYFIGHYEDDINFDSFNILQLAIIFVTLLYFILFGYSYYKSSNKKLLYSYYKKKMLFPHILSFIMSIGLLFVSPIFTLLINCIIINTTFKLYIDYYNDINSTLNKEVSSLDDDEISEYLLSKNTQTSLEII